MERANSIIVKARNLNIKHAAIGGCGVSSLTDKQGHTHVVYFTPSGAPQALTVVYTWVRHEVDLKSWSERVKSLEAFLRRLRGNT